MSGVLCVCKTWSVSLREELTLKVFMNMVWGKVFRPERWEVTGELRKLHNEEYQNLYF